MTEWPSPGKTSVVTGIKLWNIRVKARVCCELELRECLGIPPGISKGTMATASLAHVRHLLCQAFSVVEKGGRRMQLFQCCLAVPKSRDWAPHLTSNFRFTLGHSCLPLQS
ncbi:hCG1818490 [Homo sapiens]